MGTNAILGSGMDDSLVFLTKIVRRVSNVLVRDQYQDDAQPLRSSCDVVEQSTCLALGACAGKLGLVMRSMCCQCGRAVDVECGAVILPESLLASIVEAMARLRDAVDLALVPRAGGQ